MQAMILAAGRGERMLPLTNTTPKPLVQLRKKFLIEYAFENLKAAGINEVVINVHHLADKIKTALGNGDQWNIKIQYSEETELLDTGGGILAAIKKNLIGKQPFMVISADLLTKFNFGSLIYKLTRLAHLILVPNPEFKPKGDFSLKNNIVSIPEIDPNKYSNNYTYANIGIFDPKFFEGNHEIIFPLSKLIKQHIKDQQITGEIYLGAWHNLGTIKDLEKINNF